MNTTACYKIIHVSAANHEWVYVKTTVVYHFSLINFILYAYTYFFFNSALPYFNIIYIIFLILVLFYIIIFKEIDSSSYLKFTLF